ncbi:MAG: nucleoside triphosphate pyrophosphohydrolase [Kiritimatiellales bacterium]|nr:nucleoside triphosphate pyrophosphohydrolase [Kiritimatiellales bacterium]MCF7863284.1 nucleoside triphosphate pyrophosphohydrolase [Kiritimatiellales bacterium]
MDRDNDNNFSPLRSVVFVSDSRVLHLDPLEISRNLFGQKGFGLSCVPLNWTLPFFIISKSLLTEYRENSTFRLNDSVATLAWRTLIEAALKEIGGDKASEIIVRSSGCTEGIDERGKFHSEVGSAHDVSSVVLRCLDKLFHDKDLKYEDIPLIVQLYATPKQRGHLSNERHCYKEHRDWMGETEHNSVSAGSLFKINIRTWRKKYDLSCVQSSTMDCAMPIRISKSLEPIAAWFTDKQLRMHLEWVWDGSTVYLVQADKEASATGINPNDQISHYKGNPLKNFAPQCVQVINKEHAEKYGKVKNVFDYSTLHLPTVNLYLLDDESVIKELSNSYVRPNLRLDLEALVKGAVVIRSDVKSTEKSESQLLPRSDELRNVEVAIEWLIEKSKSIVSLKLEARSAFIFHCFIPALSSAFAYAVPGERKVQIESLWGIPEGLYYNAHDKYIVDTGNPKISKVEDAYKDYKVKSMPLYKNFFVCPDPQGKWTIQHVKPPYDWRKSIPHDDWIRQIAHESRRIAEFCGEPLSIMWFVGVPEDICNSPLLAWHHETFRLTKGPRVSIRKKTPHDKSFIIKSRADIETLRAQIQIDNISIKRISIKPHEENLLRDKTALETVGKLALTSGATIVMEGGMLSHAYYQLMRLEVPVEILHPFKNLNEKREFNKLVRDKIPEFIESFGELVEVKELEGAELLIALREKLVEEAFEVLDSADYRSLLEELADVVEIIDSILKLIDESDEELEHVRKEKRKKRGGFDKGLILVETNNPAPTGKNDLNGATGSLHFIKSPSNALYSEKTNDDVEIWEDKRSHLSEEEALLNIKIPVVLGNWKSSSRHIEFSNGTIRYQLKGKRNGETQEVMVSLFMKHQQLDFFNNLFTR